MKRISVLYKLWSRSDNILNYHIWYIKYNGITIKRIDYPFKIINQFIEFHDITYIEVINSEEEYIIKMNLNSKDFKDNIIINKNKENELFKETILFILNKGVKINMIGFSDNYFYNDIKIYKKH